MSNDPVDGGTVTQPAWPIERIEPRDGGVSFLLHLVGGDTIRRSRGEVEAMGLTCDSGWVGPPLGSSSGVTLRCPDSWHVGGSGDTR